MGATTRLLVDRFGCRVVGIDISPANATEAARHAYGGADLDFLSGDAHHIPIAKDTFDVAILECALSEDGYRKLLKEAGFENCLQPE